MERKWQIFKIVCIIQLIITGSFIALLGLVGIDEAKFNSVKDVYFFLLGVAIFLVLLCFYILCTQFIFRHYPNQKITAFKNNSFSVLFWMCLVLEVLLLILIISAIIDYSKISNSATKWGYFIMIFLLVLYFILLLHTLLFSWHLRKIINNNVRKLENEAIENLGKEPALVILDGD